MSSDDRFGQRLAAVERAVVDGDARVDDLEDLAALRSDIADLESRLETHEQRLATLESRLEAVDGVVGTVEAVNEDVERRADAAVAAVDRLEYRIDELERLETEATPGALEADTRPLETRSIADGSGTATTPGATDGQAAADVQPERTATAILAEPGGGDTDGPDTDGGAPTTPSTSDGRDGESSGLLAALRSRLP